MACETYEVYINDKTGKITIENIGKTNLADQYMCKFIGKEEYNETYTGFHCKKSKIQQMFNGLKKNEIKDRQEQIKQLEKEIQMYENAELPKFE